MVPMTKIEIFLPLSGMAGAMDAYFEAQGVIRLGGLPTGSELSSAELTEEELLEIGREAAQAKVDERSRFTGKQFTVEADAPFIGEFLDGDGQQIGWEFEFQVYEEFWDGEDEE